MQRNYYVSFLRKTKKQYYANLDEKTLMIIKKIWKTVQSLLSDKIKSNQKSTVEDDKIFTQDIKVAEEQKFNGVKNLKISEYSETISLAKEIRNGTLKLVLKYDKHPSVTAIGNLSIRSHFEFSFVSVDEVLKEIKKLNPRKAAQTTDVPVKTVRDNTDIFVDF